MKSIRAVIIRSPYLLRRNLYESIPRQILEEDAVVVAPVLCARSAREGAAGGTEKAMNMRPLSFL